MADEKKTIGNLMTKILAEKKYRKILIVAGLGLMALIFLSGLWEDQEKDTEAFADSALQEQTVAEYTAELENNLTDMISRIKGVGAAKVMVTIEKGVEQIYATEEKTSKQVTNDQSADFDTKNQEQDSTETTYILLKDADGGQKAVAVTQIQPVVKGVVVVCEGGENIKVQQQIIDAVTTALDISSTKVCVVSAQ